MNEKSYLFNPFVTNTSDQEIAEEYGRLQNTVAVEPKGPREYAHNIEVYANMNYLVGEIVARKTEEYSKLKTEISISQSKQVYMQRKQYSETQSSKTPAMSYFEAMATEYVKDDLIVLAKLESTVKRFKNAYSSIESKQNAIKKQLEALKYEEFN